MGVVTMTWQKPADPPAIIPRNADSCLEETITCLKETSVQKRSLAKCYEGNGCSLFASGQLMSEEVVSDELDCLLRCDQAKKKDYMHKRNVRTGCSLLSRSIASGTSTVMSYRPSARSAVRSRC